MSVVLSLGLLAVSIGVINAAFWLKDLSRRVRDLELHR